MYFVIDGAIGIGFSLIVKGYSQKQFSIGKKLLAPQLICDHYVVNNKRSQFIYISMKQI